MHVQALLRHVGHPHPALRAHLLLIVGNLRLRRLQTVIQSPFSSFADADAVATDGNIGDGAPRHGSSLAAGEPPKPAPLYRALKSAAAAALTAALRVSVSRGGHDWGVLSGSCMGLVVLYLTTAANSSGGGKGLGQDEQGRMAAREDASEDATGTCSELEVSDRLQDGHTNSALQLTT